MHVSRSGTAVQNIEPQSVRHVERVRHATRVRRDASLTATIACSGVARVTQGWGRYKVTKKLFFGSQSLLSTVQRLRQTLPTALPRGRREDGWGGGAWRVDSGGGAGGRGEAPPCFARLRAVRGKCMYDVAVFPECALLRPALLPLAAVQC